MIKITIYFLLMFCSRATFGQDVIGFRAEPNGNFGDRVSPLPEDTKLLMEKYHRIVSYRNVIENSFWVNPNMPIVDLPKDFPSDMPIKKLPEDFPSDMPIIGEKLPEMEPLLRRWRGEGPYIYRETFPKFEVPRSFK